jgi:hypothetical protein
VKEEFIKFMEQQEVLGYRLDGPSEHIVRECIDQFFDQYQPERSKREDSLLISEYDLILSKYLLGEINYKEMTERCGALNIVETQ